MCLPTPGWSLPLNPPPPSAGIMACTTTPSQPTTWSLFQSQWDSEEETFLGSSLPLIIHFHKPFPSVSVIPQSGAQAPRWDAILTFYLSLHPSPRHCWPMGSTPEYPHLPKPLTLFILTRLPDGSFVWAPSCSPFLSFFWGVWSWGGVEAKLYTWSTAEQHPQSVRLVWVTRHIYIATRMGLSMIPWSPQPIAFLTAQSDSEVCIPWSSPLILFSHALRRAMLFQSEALPLLPSQTTAWFRSQISARKSLLKWLLVPEMISPSLLTFVMSLPCS